MNILAGTIGYYVFVAIPVAFTIFSQLGYMCRAKIVTSSEDLQRDPTGMLL